ncbi:hypothetical protein BC831DRAFT_474303 [Entophlyctis helioformis]|nr:hypothetical protein BC831DRAFT_474303 [Entophlyctis helioformis]
MSAPAYPTLFGKRIWPTTFLKFYFPFFMVGSTMYFLVAKAHTAMTNAADDKWVNIVSNVEEATARQKLKADAEAYLKKLASGDHKH